MTGAAVCQAVVSMDYRLSSLDFDIAASAGWFSAIAGLVLTTSVLAPVVCGVEHVGTPMSFAAWVQVRRCMPERQCLA